MKVAVSCLCDISKSDGTSVRAKRIFDVLQKKYDCTFISRGEYKNEHENVEVVRPSKLWNFQLIPIVLKNRFDLVYCSNDFWGFLTYLALAKMRTCKVVLEAHGVISQEREERYPDPNPIEKVRLTMLKWREEFAVKHADCVIALAEDIYKRYGKLNKRIVTIQNFVDEKQFTPQESPRRIIDSNERKNVGLIGPFIRDLDVSRNFLVNGHFLDFVYENISEFDPRINFVVIGECDYRIANERISYTGYLGDFQDYIDQLRLLDAVLVPSKFSSFGALTKMLEPMACSVPIFTTPQGAVSIDYAAPGENIFVFNEAEMVAKVNEYIFDVELMDRVGKNARRTIEKYYSEAVNSEKLTAVVDQICRPGSSRIAST